MWCVQRRACPHPLHLNVSPHSTPLINYVIPFKERVFTMDFTRTTPFHESPATYDPDGHETKPHQPARRKSLSDHDRNRIRSAPFEMLSDLTSLNEFKNFAFAMLAVGFAVVGAVTAALAIVAIRPVTPSGEDAQFLAPWPLTAVSLAIFASVLSGYLFLVHCCSKVARFLRRVRK